MADQLRYLFIDFNAFFAAVEQHDDPSALGRPLIVIPLKSHHTSAIAASYEARRFGIKRGTSVRDAKALCPDIVIRHARHDRYVALHKQLLKEVDRHLPIDKVYSIDEWACRLSPSEAHRDKAYEIAHSVQQGILSNIGPALRSSVGVAPSRLLAKLAAELHKPDGLTILGMDDLPGKLLDIDIRDIPGVGSGVEARLNRAGINSFDELWNIQPKQARALWGSVQGERFWYALHGFDTDESAPQKKSMIGHSRVLSREHEAPDKARIVARALLIKAASRLRLYDLYASRISLSVRMRSGDVSRPWGRYPASNIPPKQIGNDDTVRVTRRSGDRWGRETIVTPSQDSWVFLHALEALWQELEGRLPRLYDGAGGHRLGGVTVYLHGLAEPQDLNVTQGDLFAGQSMAEVGAKSSHLWKAIDDINADLDRKMARLGGKENKRPASGRYINLASQMGLDLEYLGAKIAFSRVPDEAEFLF